jgi:hypothetical protein
VVEANCARVFGDVLIVGNLFLRLVIRAWVINVEEAEEDDGRGVERSSVYSGVSIPEL